MTGGPPFVGRLGHPATVVTARTTTVQVDLLRHGDGWLLSFSDGDDPLPALAGTT